MRVIFGCVTAVAAALLFGLIMGEYELLGFMALLAGVLFGLAVAEAAITVGKSSDWLLVGVTALAAFVGMTWAAAIDAGDSLSRVATMRWAGSLLAALSAGYWVRALGSRAIRNPFAEAPAGSEPSPER